MEIFCIDDAGAENEKLQTEENIMKKCITKRETKQSKRFFGFHFPRKLSSANNKHKNW